MFPTVFIRWMIRVMRGARCAAPGKMRPGCSMFRSPISEQNPHYLRFTTRQAGQGFANQGYDGIALKKEMSYHVSFYARCVSYEGEDLTTRVSKDGRDYARADVQMSSTFSLC